MKRSISFLLIFMLTCYLALPAFAAEDTYVQPRYKHIAVFSADISYGSWGIATCTSSVIIDSGCSVTLTLSLQKSSDGPIWENVETWSDAGTSGAFISEERALYSKYSYRVLATAYVYDSTGRLVETESLVDS